MSQIKRETSFPGWGFRCAPSPEVCALPSHQCPVTMSGIERQTQGSRPLLLDIYSNPVHLLLRNIPLLFPGHNHGLCLPGWY